MNNALKKLEGYLKEDAVTTTAYIKTQELLKALCNVLPSEKIDILRLCLGDERGISLCWPDQRLYCEIEPEGMFSTDQLTPSDGLSYNHDVNNFGPDAITEVVKHIATLLAV